MQPSSSVNVSLQSVNKSISYQAAALTARKIQWVLFTGVLIVSDLVMLAAAFRAAYFIRFQSSIGIFHLEVIPEYNYYFTLILILMPMWVLLFGILGLYRRTNLLWGSQEYSLLFNASTVGIVGVIAAGFLLPELVLARGWLLMAWALSFLMTAGGRFIVRRLVYLARKRGFLLSSALIVGANEEALMLADQLLNWETSGIHLVGFVTQDKPAGTTLFHHLKSLGNVDALPSILKHHEIEDMILATSSLTRNEMVSIFKTYGMLKNLNLRLSSGMFEIITTGIQVSEIANVPLVRVNKVRLTGIDKVLKTILDYSITIPGLILISPLMMLLALLVKLDSKGPIIHRRRVMGVNGSKFDAFKFRTMRIDGDLILESSPELKAKLERDGKLVDDPRITRLGNLLRKTSLDELPQLFNVLRREMSLVGPRMISPSEIIKYNRWDTNLLTIPPGITGLWQVSGRSNVSYEERVRLDMYYIRNWSIWLDLKLLIETIPAVLLRRGAY
jgi:exopolysaccharide biosynthesis polyprenyl glycosylphosphotransferase